jgi:hypothetical protein
MIQSRLPRWPDAKLTLRQSILGRLRRLFNRITGRDRLPNLYAKDRR